jgi:hypothetical protein
MANIVYTLRVSKQTADEIARMSCVYGSKTPRAFAREILEVMCSGDEQRVGAFLTRLFERITGQMALQLTETAMKPARELRAARILHAKRTQRTKRTKRT